MCAGAGFVITMANIYVTIRAQSDPSVALRSLNLFDFFQGVSGDSYGDPHW